MADEWYGIRCVYRHTDDSTEATYEERVTLWAAGNFDEAIRLAEADAEDYAQTLECEYLGLAQAFQLDEPPGQGTEVFSLLRNSPLDAAEYLSTYFTTGHERERSAGE